MHTYTACATARGRRQLLTGRLRRGSLDVRRAVNRVGLALPLALALALSLASLLVQRSLLGRDVLCLRLLPASAQRTEISSEGGNTCAGRKARC